MKTYVVNTVFAFLSGIIPQHTQKYSNTRIIMLEWCWNFTQFISRAESVDIIKKLQGGTNFSISAMLSPNKWLDTRQTTRIIELDCYHLKWVIKKHIEKPSINCVLMMRSWKMSQNNCWREYQVASMKTYVVRAVFAFLPGVVSSFF